VKDFERLSPFLIKKTVAVFRGVGDANLFDGFKPAS